MGLELTLHQVGGVQVGRVTGSRRHATGRKGRVGHVVVADVVGNILADEQVVRIVGSLIGLPVSKCPGIDDIECTQPALKGPVEAGVIVLDVVPLEALDLVVIIEVGVGVKRAVTVDFLDHCAHLDAPVVIDVPKGADASTPVGGIVKVLLNQVGIVGIDKVDVTQVGARLEAAPIGLHYRAV